MSHLLTLKKNKKRTYPPDSHFDFTKSDDDVSVETDIKEELSCDICESKFKSIDNLKRHDIRFHITQGTDTTFKCDFFNENLQIKEGSVITLKIHIRNVHFVPKHFQLQNL